MTNSAYIVQTTIIPLGETPFHSSLHFRKTFQKIFTNENCFADMQFSFPKKGMGNLEYTYRSQPFIRDIGQVHFDTRSIRVGRPRSNLARFRVASILAKNYSIWNPRRGRENIVRIENKNRFFGLDHKIEDQRLNYLHFETKPLSITASFAGQTVADGKIFIHLYPSGFILIHLAISINYPDKLTIEDISNFMNECYPSRYDGKWEWNSHIASGKLPSVIYAIKSKISKSLFTEDNLQLKDGTWRSTIKLVTTLDAQEVASALIKGKCEKFNLGLYKGKDGKSNESMIVSHQSLICLISPFRSRISSIHLLWKIIYLYHFVLFKSQVYEAYADYLAREVENLKEYRLSPVSKFTKEDVRHLFVYDPTIPKYLNALDRFILPAQPFYRRVYSAITDGTDFNDKRNKILESVKNWESEVEQWDHPIVAVWKNLISPLRSLLGL